MPDIWAKSVVKGVDFLEHPTSITKVTKYLHDTSSPECDRLPSPSIGKTQVHLTGGCVNASLCSAGLFSVSEGIVMKNNLHVSGPKQF